MPLAVRKSVPDNLIMTNLATTGKGLLSDEQSDTFLDMVYDTATLVKETRREKRRAKHGYINKIALKPRIARPKQEGEWDGKLTKPTTSTIEYLCKPMRVDWEMTAETLRENIEGAKLEQHIMNLMAAQVARDLEDLLLNGDSATPAKIDDPDSTATPKTQIDNPDYSFLSMNDGWIKQIKNGGHVMAATGNDQTKFSIGLFSRLKRKIPSKYFNSQSAARFRWLMSPNTQSGWEEWILTQAAESGGIVTDKRVESPCGHPILTCPYIPDGTIMFLDPKNLVTLNTYEITIYTIRPQTSLEAARRDIVGSVIFLDADGIVEELDATAILTGFNPTL